jgi:sodium/hydrogen antiporter
VVLVSVFGVALVLAVLVSGLAARTVLSTSLLVLVGGAVVGPGGLGLVDVTPEGGVVERLADLALFTVLFVDGQKAGVRDLFAARQLAGRALLLGMPLNFVGIALLVTLFTDLHGVYALLVAAILSPTDPVFASALVGREDVPTRLRRLLNVESGVNDGLALPVVLVLLAVAEDKHSEPGLLVAELAGGLALGVAVPVVVWLLQRVRVLGAEQRLQPLTGLAIGVTLFGLASVTHANPYLAAFAAGSTVATLMPSVREAFHELGELLAEVAKLAALLVFGALLTPELLGEAGVGGWAVALLAVLVVRPGTLLLSLTGADLPRKQRFAAAWFGPKGFASVVYGLLVVNSGVDQAAEVFAVVAVATAVSILLHSSTDVLVARRFAVEDVVACTSDVQEAAWQTPEPRHPAARPPADATDEDATDEDAPEAPGPGRPG